MLFLAVVEYAHSICLAGSVIHPVFCPLFFSGPLSGGQVSRQHATIKCQGLEIEDTKTLIMI
jgi:hypothetical protein